MSEDEQLIDSDLEDYDTDVKETDNYEIMFPNEGDGSLGEFFKKGNVGYIPGGSNVQPWKDDRVDKKEFFNFGLNEHQWKLLVNKHILMLYEKHIILKTNPNIQAAQNLALKQMERGMQIPGMFYPNYQMMMQYPQYYEQDEGVDQENVSDNSD